MQEFTLAAGADILFDIRMAGQAIVHGASQSPVCSESRSDSAVLRISSTSGLDASISCPGAGTAAQLGIYRPVFLSRTTQTKQLVVLEIRLSRQSVGILIPFAVATSRMGLAGFRRNRPAVQNKFDAHCSEPFLTR